MDNNDVKQTSAPKKFVQEVKDEFKYLEDAIEKWYEKHFNNRAVAGTSPISAEDKALLIQHVTDAAKAKE